jgi:hypothetical protein
MRFLLPLALFGLIACGPKEKEDDTGDTGEVEDTGTADTGPADTGEVESLLGLQGRHGELVKTDTSLAGIEQLSFIADEGDGEDLCRIQYEVTSTAIRDDCEICNETDDDDEPYGWAFDVTFSNPEITAESSPGCLATLGYDKSNITDISGETRGMGYTPEYIGHASVIMIDVDGIWTAVANAEFVEEVDKTTKKPTGVGELTYDWQDGYIEYSDDSE